MPQTLKLKIPDESIASFSTPTDLSAATGGANTPVPYQFTYQHTFQATPLPERAISPKAQIPPPQPQQPIFAPSPLSGPPLTKHIPLPAQQQTKPASPERPPVEPIDPVEVLEQLGKVPAKATKKSPLPEPTFIHRPDPVPISESENSDAIALRSAIALLQLQREKSKRDIQALEKVRLAALRDPAGFVEETKKRVGSQKQGSARRDEDILTPTLEGRRDALVRQSHKGASESQKDGQQNGVRQQLQKGTSGLQSANNQKPEADSDSDSSSEDETSFPTIPTPQNVFRMPPINWAKYHIAGDTLEKMHNEEIVRPNLGQPERKPSATFTPTSAVAGGFPFSAGGAAPRGTPMGSSYGFPLSHPVTGRNPSYVLAAPYSPLTDVLVPSGDEPIHPMQTRKGSKKPGM